MPEDLKDMYADERNAKNVWINRAQTATANKNLDAFIRSQKEAKSDERVSPHLVLQQMEHDFANIIEGMVAFGKDKRVIMKENVLRLKVIEKQMEQGFLHDALRSLSYPANAYLDGSLLKVLCKEFCKIDDYRSARAAGNRAYERLTEADESSTNRREKEEIRDMLKGLRIRLQEICRMLLQLGDQ